MWYGQTAIPAIAPYARVRTEALHAAFLHLRPPQQGTSGKVLTVQFAHFERRQPMLAERLARGLAAPMDEAARGLGIMLVLATWMAFEQTATHGLHVITAQDWNNAEQILQFDEHLRAQDPMTLVESDDVIAAQQPELAAFVRSRIDETVRTYEDVIDLDDVDAVYRLVLVEVLALSYAVEAPSRVPLSQGGGVC